MGLEAKLRRIEYLERLASRIESALISIFVALLAPIVLEKVVGVKLITITVVLVAGAVLATVVAYRLRARIERMWREVLKEDPKLVTIPWIGIIVVAFGLAVLITMLLG